MSDGRTLQPGPWRKTPGWRAGAFLIGITLLLWFLDWLTGDLVDVGWWRPFAVFVLGLLFSVPYGWAWVKGHAPPPPPAAVLVPQATVQGGEQGSTYVIVGPTGAASRPGLGRRARDLGPLAWFLYTVLWRWPLMVGDAVLTILWRGMTRIFGFQGGPSIGNLDPGQMDQVDDLEERPPPGSRLF
ncbi:MAG TPA: hypothetical protein VK904_05115 [Miltoncostaeaceae bacterium]|nr:hypothetical protein [Miltoncostaeaceae bacterium]